MFIKRLFSVKTPHLSGCKIHLENGVVKISQYITIEKKSNHHTEFDEKDVVSSLNNQDDQKYKKIIEELAVTNLS